MTYEAGVRRVAPDATPLPDSDPVLVELLRTEIEASGPITFARFMTVALTEPGPGYYAPSTDRPPPGSPRGRSGRPRRSS